MSIMDMPPLPTSAPPCGDLGQGCYEINARFAPLLAASFISKYVGPTTLCAIYPDTRGVPACWLQPADVSTAAAWIEYYNLRGYNIYFELNLPRQGLTKKAEKADIVELRGVAADIDAKNGRSMDEAFASIALVGVAPRLIIATGGGYQPIWLLPSPLPATLTNIQRVEAAGVRIERLTGSDAIHNINRILRMPFTKNYPNKSKIEAGRIVCNSGLVLPKVGEADGQLSARLGSVVP